MRCLLLVVAFLAAAVPVARTEDKPAVAEGSWVLSTSIPFGDLPVCLIKSESKDGKLSLSIAATPPNVEGTISEVKSDTGLSFKLKTVQSAKNAKGVERKFVNERVFVAAPSATGKVIFGSLGTDAFPQRAKLTPTDSEKLTTMVKGPAFESMSTIQGLNKKAAIAQNKARREKDAEKKKELRAAAEDAQKAADEKMPDLFRGIVKEFPESDAAVDAATNLINTAAKSKVTADEAAALAKLILERSAPYGPRFIKPTAIRLAEALVRQKGLEAVALLPLEPIVNSISEKDPLAFQFDTLTTYRTALAAAGRKDELKSLDERLVKLDVALDKEWGETVPPFKPAAFAGRTDSSRIAVMELFTGAQCGPCIAADVAFDGIHKAFKPTDVILLQYHMHIPGPDPLTNPAAVGRWDYYSEMFPYDPDTGTGVGGTPTTIFNGKPMAGGGGGMTNAENKFKEYRKILEPLLEKTSAIKLNGTATRDGDKLAIAVDVAGVEAKDNLKLRLLVVEDTIKYVGGNKIRFHHQVVRAMPGGVDGVAIKDASMKHTATADVAAIRKELVSYLDEYAAKERPFPYPTIRPLDLKDLKVIAIVQNDKTREIVQAVQFDVSTSSK